VIAELIGYGLCWVALMVCASAAVLGVAAILLGENR
jgi:hypothetical protein